MDLGYSGLQWKRVGRRWNRGEGKGEYEREWKRNYEHIMDRMDISTVR